MKVNPLRIRYQQRKTIFCCLCVAVLYTACNQITANKKFEGIILDTVKMQIQNENLKITPKLLGMRSEMLTTPFKPVGFDTVHIGNNVYYIIEGDLLISASELQKRLAKTRHAQKNFAQPQHLLTEKAIIKFDLPTNDTVKWRKFPITYCIDRASFSSVANGYNRVKTSVQQAVIDWENVCGVKFVYHSELDGRPGLILGKDIDFIISYKAITSDNYVSTSFFPEDPQNLRMLLVYAAYWNTPYNPVGVFRHELGHVLGFRHEESINSPDIPSYCRQTPTPGQTSIGIRYDNVSVMHYYCGGNGTLELNFSDNDKLAFAMIYPKY